MYQMAKSAREALKSKAKRLASEKVGKVDATSVSRPEAFEADKKTGLQPTTRRAYKKGGAVKEGRKGKDLGGVAEVLSPAYAAVRALQRGGKDQERDAAEQAKGAAMANAMRKNGGKAAKRPGRKNGGVTVINIGKGASDAPMAAPRPVPVPMPQVSAPPPMQSQMPAVPPPPPPAPGAQKSPLALKTGGRATKVAKSYKDMRAGAGSGEGRLQKTDIAKKRA